jgi:hypothetical protein
MRGLVALCACSVAAVMLPSAASAAMGVRLAVKPASPRAGAEALVELRPLLPLQRKDGSCCRFVAADPRGYPFRLEAVSPTGRLFRVRVTRTRPFLWTGSFRFDRPGRWQLRVANYAPDYRAARVFVRVRSSVATPQPAGFGPLGAAGCEPPSARNRAGQRFPALGEVFGTGVGGQLWALFFGGDWASAESAVLAGVVGKEVKIVFRITGSGTFDIAATAPGGTRIAPAWGPVFHPSSTWRRPGREWGTSFVFTQTGCWRIHATHGGVSGDVWLLVES